VVKRAAAMPYPVNPVVWAGVVETQTFYAKTPVDLQNSTADPLDKAEFVPKPQQTAVMLAAKRSPLGRAYLDWSRFPILETEPLQPPDSGYVVTFRDLRFEYSFLNAGQPRRTPLSASVVLDRNLHVVAMRMGNREEK
jgi:inner membrane protein